MQGKGYNLQSVNRAFPQYIAFVLDTHRNLLHKGVIGRFIPYVKDVDEPLWHSLPDRG
jgi:hypothetical protein